MKYVNKDFFGTPLYAYPTPFKSVINNGFVIQTQSDLLIRQLEKNEQLKMSEVIDWHLFKEGKTILIDDYHNQYGCISKSEGHVRLAAIVGINLLDVEVGTKLYDIALMERDTTDGLSKEQIMVLFDMLKDTEAYLIELDAHEHGSIAAGFITPKAANMLDCDYERSGLHDFIADILDDKKKEAKDCAYEFKGVRIWLRSI